MAQKMSGLKKIILTTAIVIPTILGATTIGSCSYDKYVTQPRIAAEKKAEAEARQKYLISLAEKFDLQKNTNVDLMYMIPPFLIANGLSKRPAGFQGYNSYDIIEENTKLRTESLHELEIEFIKKYRQEHNIAKQIK